jgi:16S rRNA (cytidine1402-2'-O)-methyltransferase
MSKLYLIPTPIGNLQDITLRALTTLKEVDLVLAEDTRVSKKLLNHFDIPAKLSSFHQHNEHKMLENIIGKLTSGLSIALVSDAGTPGISDPGFLLVRECIQHDIPVEALPGATAFVPALVVSGLPSDRFVFEGFLPHKKGRQTKFKELAEETRTIVLYESPHRIIKTLEGLKEFLGEDRPCSVSREITKMFEETVRGTLAEVSAHFQEHAPKGEFVMVIGGAPKKK